MVMNTKTILLLAGAGAVAAYLLKGKKEALENLKISPLDIAIDTQKSKATLWTKLYYNIKLKLINSSSFSINVKSIDLDFSVNGKILANIQRDQNITVPGKDDKVITLSSYIASATAIETILDILADSSKIKLAVTGEVVTDLGAIIINYSKNAAI